MEINKRYLFDTNICLELMLNQEQAEIGINILQTVSLSQIYISDFTLHSIGVIVSRLKKTEIFNEFIQDVFIQGKLVQLSLEPTDLIDLVHYMNEYSLDFDEAYQLTVSKKYELTIVTFDRDFKNKGLDLVLPNDLL